MIAYVCCTDSSHALIFFGKLDEWRVMENALGTR